MKFASIFSGIEAASCAWIPLGMECAFTAEIEPFPCAVLKAHYPSVPNFGDVTKFKEWPDADVDVLIGGSPCQSFSVAGLREGLADPRGNLTLTYLAVVARYRPRWVVWENVPGVLSVDGGRVFGAFIGGLGKLGYGIAYRVLNAQYFGVPQRRRRVFVVGYLGDWHRAAAVLFERSSLSGDIATGREEGEGAAADTSGIAGSGRIDSSPDGIAGNVSRKWAKGTGGPAGDECYNLISAPVSVSEPIMSDGKRYPGTTPDDCENLIAFNARQGPIPGPIPGPIDTDSMTQAVFVPDVAGPIGGAAQSGGFRTTDLDNQGAFVVESRFARNGRGAPSEVCPQLKAQSGQSGKGDAAPLLGGGGRVRRLTPRECERLQGFMDDWTLVNFRGKPAADGNRYKALGNSMAVPVISWIGERLLAVETIISTPE